MGSVYKKAVRLAFYNVLILPGIRQNIQYPVLICFTTEDKAFSIDDNQPTLNKLDAELHVTKSEKVTHNCY